MSVAKIICAEASNVSCNY